jgi:hypothetical protein
VRRRSWSFCLLGKSELGRGQRKEHRGGDGDSSSSIHDLFSI